MTGLLAPLLPRFKAEGKSYLTVALGCTGGRHRSVFVAEALAKWFDSQGETVQVRHRDIGLAEPKEGSRAELRAESVRDTEKR